MIVYTEPRFAPLPGPAGTDWQRIADKLAEQPYSWAAVGGQDTGRWPMNRRRCASLQVEVSTTRSNGDGTYTVWMRHVPGGERVQPTAGTPAISLDPDFLAVAP